MCILRFNKLQIDSCELKNELYGGKYITRKADSIGITAFDLWAGLLSNTRIGLRLLNGVRSMFSLMSSMNSMKFTASVVFANLNSKRGQQLDTQPKMVNEDNRLLLTVW